MALPDELRAALRAYPDFPTPGILFQDISPILADPRLLARTVEAMARPHAGRVDKVAGIEARGFLLGAPIALSLGVGFVPLRKAGKLPGPTVRDDYSLEYAKASLEAQEGALAPGERVLVVDDVLATAGTALAAARLVRRAGAEVAAFAFLLELSPLGGRARLDAPADAILSI